MRTSVVAFVFAVVVISLVSSLDGDDRCEDAVDGGWSETSIPLSCWSKLLDFDETLSAKSCDMLFVVFVTVLVEVIIAELTAGVELWLKGLAHAFRTLAAVISILSSVVLSLDSTVFGLSVIALISSASLEVVLKASLDRVFKRFSFCLTKRGASLLCRLLEARPVFELILQLNINIRY